MATTDHGLVYPNSSGNVQMWTHLQNLAESVEAAFDAYETFTSWTPTFTNGPTTIGVGGFSEGFYTKTGGWVKAQFRIHLGTGFAFTGGTFELVLPFPSYIWEGGTFGQTGALGNWTIRDDSAIDHFAGTIGVFETLATRACFNGAWDGTAPNSRVSSAATHPITWAAGDMFSGNLQYRAAS